MKEIQKIIRQIKKNWVVKHRVMKHDNLMQNIPHVANVYEFEFEFMMLNETFGEKVEFENLTAVKIVYVEYLK